METTGKKIHKKSFRPLYGKTFCLGVVLFVLFFTAAAFGAGGRISYHYANAENTSDFAGGDGSKENPFIVTTPKHLENIRKYVYVYDEDNPFDYFPYYFALGADVDLKDTLGESGSLHNGGKGWIPIGDNVNFFCGVLDGRGYTIRNLWLEDPEMENAGLFGNVYDTVIQNLNIVLDSRGILAYSGGGLVGYLESYNGECRIENCSVTGNIFTKQPEEDRAAGGYGAAGGFAGVVKGAVIVNSYYIGKLNTDCRYTGGLVGVADGVTVENCYVKAVIRGQSNFGGIIGRTYEFSPSLINDCYVDLICDDNMDVFVGVVDKNTQCMVGFSYSVRNGKISLDEKYLTINSQVLSAEQTKTEAAYVGFNFNAIWGIFENIGTPYLKNFNNAVLILPGKIYDGTPDFISDFQYLGNYNEAKLITLIKLTEPVDKLPDRHVDIYPMEIDYATEYAYQVYIAPLYEIRRAELTVSVENQGRINPVFIITDITGFKMGDDESVINGLFSFNYSVKNLRRGVYEDVKVNAGLSTSNYEIKYNLAVTGLYTYEIILIIAGCAVSLAFAVFIFVWHIVEKKTFADLGRAFKKIFIKEKTVTVEVVKEVRVEVLKEVPVHSGKSLPINELTHREKEVAELLLLGKSRREIAKALYISEHTVKSHSENIFSKCYVKTQKAFIGKYLLDADNKSDNENQEKNVF
ncbi:MAG: LuxR C-terminal-related transcriptional regulator [Firmicutes bacterium]|nr:LuxR C-terminal-related transcriptional regulator [Bacillota bacterium]